MSRQLFTVEQLLDKTGALLSVGKRTSAFRACDVRKIETQASADEVLVALTIDTGHETESLMLTHVHIETVVNFLNNVQKGPKS